MKSLWTRLYALMWTVKDPLAEQCATASMDWIDEQLRTNAIDYGRVHARINDLLREHFAAKGRDARVLRPHFAVVEQRAVVGESSARWLPLAAGLVIALVLTAIIISNRRQSPPGPVSGRVAAGLPRNDWTKYCGSLSMDGVAVGERVLSTVTVSHLRLLWSRTLSGPVASAASVARGKVYVGEWGGNEWALDAADGAIIASIDLGQTRSKACNHAVLGISSSAAIVDNIAYVAGGDDAFYALNADDLSVVWRKSLGDNSATGGYYGWSSPAVAGGKVIQGIASNCDNPFPRGALVGLDPATGVELASAYFVPENRVGGGVSTSPAVDTRRRGIFVTTGSAQSFDDGDAFSMVRLNLDTFEIEDRWKLPNDTGAYWDADWGSSPTLFVDASGRELVGAGQKDGGYYAFSRNDLAAGPVWVAPIAIAGKSSRHGEGTPSTASFDGKTLYIGGGIPPKTDDPSVLGAVTAVSPDDGKILWRHTFQGPVIAPVSFANGVVFAVGGTSVVALDAASGSVLWSYEMKAPSVGGVAIARGRIYVGDLSGTLYAWSLEQPKTLHLPRFETVGTRFWEGCCRQMIRQGIHTHTISARPRREHRLTVTLSHVFLRVSLFSHAPPGNRCGSLWSG